jgi:rare lipoprotein A
MTSSMHVAVARRDRPVFARRASAKVVRGRRRALVVSSILAVSLVVVAAVVVRMSRTDSGPVAVYPYYKVGAPYQINGVWYQPAENFRYRKTGVASFYGGERRGVDFHGRTTANGEIYDMHALTAAHPTLPLPTLVSVTNLENGRSIVVRVNDRGPFVDGRIIDVSRRAAQELGFERQGTASVRVEVLTRESRALKQVALRGKATQ